jgi:ATP-dependent Lon protease
MKLPDILPVLPLKDVVLFPYIILPLSVGRDKSIQAVDQALAENRIIMLAAQKDSTVEEPGQDDIYHWGTAALIMRMLKLPDGRIRILVQGLSRARIEHFSQTEPFLKAKVEQINEYPVDEPSLELEALTRAVKEGLDTVVNLGKNISSEVMILAANLDVPGRLADLAAGNLELKTEDAQKILEASSPSRRLRPSTISSCARSSCSRCSRRSRSRPAARWTEGSASTTYASSSRPSSRSWEKVRSSTRRSPSSATSPRKRACLRRPTRRSKSSSSGWSGATPRAPRPPLFAPIWSG